MAILNDLPLVIYCEVEDLDPPRFSEYFLVGLFEVVAIAEIERHMEDLKYWKSRSRIQKLLVSKPTFEAKLEIPICKAAAYVKEAEKTLWVENVGADKGYGPTLYAAVLEVARARKLNGVMPCLDPSYIQDKPKKIWQRFAQDPVYHGKVHTTATLGRHLEPWLNQLFSISNGQSLFDYTSKRQRWRTLSNFMDDEFREWRSDAFDVAHRSVEYYQK